MHPSSDATCGGEVVCTGSSVDGFRALYGSIPGTVRELELTMDLSHVCNIRRTAGRDIWYILRSYWWVFSTDGLKYKLIRFPQLFESRKLPSSQLPNKHLYNSPTSPKMKFNGLAVAVILAACSDVASAHCMYPFPDSSTTYY